MLIVSSVEVIKYGIQQVILILIRPIFAIC